MFVSSYAAKYNDWLKLIKGIKKFVPHITTSQKLSIAQNLEHLTNVRNNTFTDTHN